MRLPKTSMKPARVKKRELAQNIVEFALAAPVFLAMLVGIFEFSRAIFVLASVYTASREAARYAIPYNVSEPPYLDCAGIRQVARQHGGPGNVQNADISIYYDHGPGTSIFGACPVSGSAITTGDRIIVQVTGHFTPAGFMPLLEIPTFNIVSTNTRTILKEVTIP
jgi:hypothetical protein